MFQKVEVSINLGEFTRKKGENLKYGSIIPLEIEIDNKKIVIDLKAFATTSDGVTSLFDSKESILNHAHDNGLDKTKLNINMLKNNNKEGLLFSTGSINGLIETLIKERKKEHIIPLLKKLKEILPELVLESYTNNVIYNEYISKLSKKLDIPIVISESKFKVREETHNILQESLKEEDNDEIYGSYNPFNVNYSLIGDNVELGKGLSGNIIDLNEKLYQGHLPTKDKAPLLPKISDTADQDMIDRCQIALKEYLDNNPLLDKKVYQDRLEKEMKIINDMGFSSYMLIVSDMIKETKMNNIPVGPGRGSAAGSLVAYMLKITDIDPIPHGLLFERFLNPERVSYPDIDMDFPMKRKLNPLDILPEEFGKYLNEKFSKDFKVSDYIYELTKKNYGLAYK